MSLSSLQNRQQKVLKNLLRQAEKTSFSRQHGFGEIKTYSDFHELVPVQSYGDIKPSISDLKNGAEDIYWPGGVNRFAVSAGTSGEGKHLPFTRARMQSDRRFMRKVALSYFRQRPNVFRLIGSHLSMPGSVEQHGNIEVGEISGFSALNAPAWLRYLQLVDPRELTRLSFQQKFDILLEKALRADLRVITAVPSWILTLFQQALEETGRSSIAEVWPNLKLLVCGGVKLANYRAHLQQLAQGLELDFIETYGASEGYIGFSDDLSKDDLKMVTDNGIFFEAIPQSGSAAQQAVPLWQIETGIPYALLLSTNAGLWRYRLNDLVEFTSVNPLRFEVKGRLNDMLDDYGEALHIYEAEEALEKVTSNMKFTPGSFSISAVLPDKNTVPYHQWFIQLDETYPPNKLKKVAQNIDQKLQEMNRHYAIRRESNALGAPEITGITQQQINEWLQKKGKQKAQAKLPRVLPKNTTSLLK